MNDNPTPVQPDTIARLTGQLSDSEYPGGISLPDGGGKFATDGSVLRWPGNTFVRHVDSASPEHDSLRALQEEVKMSRFAHLFNYLPPASFHMTMFQGVSPEAISTEDLPTGATPGMPRDELSALMLDAVKGVSFDPTCKAKVIDVFAAHSLTMTGAGSDGDAPWRKARETLRTTTGINPPDFDQYTFHITLAYPAQWLTEATAHSLVEFSAELTQRYSAQLAEVPLGAIEFCNFETMHHFEPLTRLL